MQSASAFVILSITSLLVGCNTRDGLYSQGPWGSAESHRNYPQYTSPWNRSYPNSNLAVVLDANYPMDVAVSQRDLKPLIETESYSRAATEPDDSQPKQSASIPPSISVSAPALKSPQSQAKNQVSAPSESPPGIFSAPRRASSYSGRWTAKDHKGRSCFIALSSVASLDLYKASTSKCASEPLKEINSWNFSEDRVVLYSRGVEIATLKGSEANLKGLLSEMGTALEMSR